MLRQSKSRDGGVIKPILSSESGHAIGSHSKSFKGKKRRNSASKINPGFALIGGQEFYDEGDDQEYPITMDEAVELDKKYKKLYMIKNGSMNSIKKSKKSRGRKRVISSGNKIISNKRVLRP